MGYENNNGAYLKDEDEQIILSLNELSKVISVVQFGPMNVRNIFEIERVDLINNICMYYLSSATIAGNPFDVVCLRNINGDKVFNNNGKFLDYSVICFAPMSLCVEHFRDELLYTKNPLSDNELDLVAFHKKTEMEDEDYLWIIHNEVLEIASLMCDYITSLYKYKGLYPFPEDT